MSKADVIEIEGVVVAKLPNAMLCWEFWFLPHRLPLPWAQRAAQTIFSKAGAECSVGSFCC